MQACMHHISQSVSQPNKNNQPTSQPATSYELYLFLNLATFAKKQKIKNINLTLNSYH